MKTRPYVGLPGRTVFRSATTPTPQAFPQFAAVIGPFRTRAGADFMAEHGRNGNPHCQCVNDAEHLAKGEAYDIVLRRWVKRA